MSEQVGQSGVSRPALEVGDAVAYEGHPARVRRVYQSGFVDLDFSAGPMPWPFFNGPYDPEELERI